MTLTQARTRTLPALLAAATLLLAAAPGWAQVVYPPGLRIGLEPPPGMQLDAKSSRFLDADGKAAIVMLELSPATFPDLENKLFGDPDKTGVTVLKRENFPFASGFGYLVSARAMADGVAYLKTVLIFNLPGLAGFVSAEIPESDTAKYPEDVVRKALASVTLRDPPIQERLGMVPFVISDLSGFTVGDVLPTAVVLNDPGNPNGLPRLVISVGPGAPEQPDDRARFARDLLENAPLPNLSLLSSEAMRIKGTPGFEIKAEARDATGTEASVVQWVRFGSGGYLMVLAVARKDEWESAYPRFRAVRDSIEARSR